MFSKEYLMKVSGQTGFRAESLQRQMTLLDLLREIYRHPRLGKEFALKGGTAINLFWFHLPRLSVDIDLNYVGSADRATMVNERPTIERELRKLVRSRGISVENAPADQHAGAKWRLRARSAFGGNFTVELDLNFLMRIPVWGVETRKPHPLDEDYVFDCQIVSIEELFAGKIKALVDRSAARDLYDVFRLSETATAFDRPKLRKALILFGVTCDEDWRKKDLRTIDAIDQRMVNQELSPLLRMDEAVELEKVKMSTMNFLSRLVQYEDDERRFIGRFLDDGVYEPELLFPDRQQAERMRTHPAVLWKLQNHRKYLGLDSR